MEIERKFLPKELPFHLEDHPHIQMEQGYLCTAPVVRVRREGEQYVLTYKSSGMMAREEYNLPLTRQAYEHLAEKIDGCLIKKTRYRIPLDNGLTAELDVFLPPHAPLKLLEVEFPNKESALSFEPPSWFGEDVTFDPRYHNSNMIHITKWQAQLSSPSSHS